MRSIRRALRLIVATGALAPLLASAPAEASVADCGRYTGWDKTLDVQTGPTIQACINVTAAPTNWGLGSWAVVGVFVTPSQTQVTTDGTEHTVRLGGGVCVTWVYPGPVTECLHDPSFTVAAGQYGYNDPWYGTGTVAYSQVVPCIDDRTWTGQPSLLGLGVGAVCVDVGYTASGGTDPDGSTSAHVLPGVCLQWEDSYTCVFLHSWTTVDGTATSQEFAVCESAPGYHPPCTYLP